MFLKEYFRDIYVHCVHYLTNKYLHWSEKIFWLICICSCTVCNYLLIKETLNDFRLQSASFSVDTNYLFWKTPFPSIIFCETDNEKIDHIYKYQWFNKSNPYFADLAVQVGKIAFYRGSLEFKDACLHEEKNDCVYFNLSYYSNIARSSCNEIFTSCYYNNEPFSCCDKFRPIGSYFGECFAINNLAARDKSGKLIEELSFYITRGPNKGQGNMSVELRHSDMLIMALSPDSVPARKNLRQILMSSEQSKIPKYRIYNIFLSITEVLTTPNALTLDVSKRGCRLQSESTLRKTETFYSFSSCDNECLIEAQRKFCGCNAHVLPNTAVENECSLNGLRCLEEKYNEILNFTHYECDCVNSCNDSVVEIVGDVHEKTNLFREKNSVQRFNFLVPAPSVRHLRNAVKEKSDILVGVSGSMGLFLGVSVLSITQLFMYFLVRPITDLYRFMRKEKCGHKNKKMDKKFSYNLRKATASDFVQKINENNRSVYVVRSYNFQQSPLKRQIIADPKKIGTFRQRDI